MKCYSCGKEYDTNDHICPYCGCITYIKDEEKKGKVIGFLEKTLPNSKLALTYMNTFLILLINIGILGLVINLFLYFTDVSPVIWCQYVIAGCFVIYMLLRLAYYTPNKRVIVFSGILQMIVITCNITQFIVTTDLWATGYLAPAVITAINLITLILYLCGRITPSTYFRVVIVNTILILVPFVLSFIPYFTFNTVEYVMIYTATVISILLLANFLFIRVIASINKFNKKI